MSPLPKILVVDDAPANLFSMRQLLAHSGAQMFEAASGEAALQLCLDHRFALILLDVHMPGMDGFEVANLLAATEQMHDTPIIFVTAAYADDLSRLKGYRAGAVDYTARCKLQEALDALSERNRQLTSEVAERARAEALVRHQASHDMLTALPNRVLFHDRLQSAIHRADRHHGQFALACLDIDGFKGVNDMHGHQAGDDERLVQAADRAMYRAKQTGKNRCVLGDDQD